MVYVIAASVFWVFVNYIMQYWPFIERTSLSFRTWVLTLFLITYCKGAAPFEGKDWAESPASRIMFYWAWGWFNLRRISYFDYNENFKTGILHHFAYLFYFPNFFAPFTTFLRFMVNNDLQFENKEKFPSRADFFREFGNSSAIAIIVRQTVVILCWTFATLFMNHAFFPVGFSFYANGLFNADQFTYGPALWLYGQWFQAKYMLLYGYPWLFSMLDNGCPLPDIPIFITRVFTYTSIMNEFFKCSFSGL